MSYIVMEFVEGQTLTQWMKKQRLSVPQIKHVIYHAGLGLAYAHENGVFHRDVKPDNIMLSTTGGVKVMDFGIARVVESSLTKTGSVMGTPAYMSPEQCNGQKVDGRSDIFSLGVILYELLTGRKPFKGDTMPSLMFAIMKEEPPEPSTVDTTVAPVWNPILKKALAKNRDERYATVKEFATRSGTPRPAEPPTEKERGGRWTRPPRRSPRPAAGAARRSPLLHHSGQGLPQVYTRPPITRVVQEFWPLDTYPSPNTPVPRDCPFNLSSRSLTSSPPLKAQQSRRSGDAQAAWWTRPASGSR